MRTNAPSCSIPVAVFSALIVFSAGSAAESGASGPASANLGAAISDTAITGKVKSRYMDDARLKNSDISVTTVNGVVTLTGTASSTSARSAAAELARTVEGVGSVENNIQAPTASAPSVGEKIESSSKHAARKGERVASDSWITTKVKSSLLADSLVKGFKIGVTTRRHVVILSGVVDTQASIDHAAELTKRIRGVESVDTSGLKTGGN